VTPHAAVRAVRRPIGSTWTPAQVALGLRGEPGLFALVGSWLGAGAIVGSIPGSTIDPGSGLDPFALLDAAEGPHGMVPPADTAEPGVYGGWIGYLGYQAGGLVERMPEPPPRPNPLPRWHLAWYDHVLRLDPVSGWWFEALVTPGSEAALDQRFDRLCRLLQGPAPEPGRVELTPFRATPSGDDHRKAVRRALDLIAAGDIYQANVCLRLDAALSTGHPLDVFAQASTALTPSYAAFLDLARGRAVSSMSPEQFLRRLGRTVTTSPIKGTRHRPGGAVDTDLTASPKDRAENVMIVDLMRNDLGRVCVPGTIGVPRLFDVEAHPGVWHLVSEVTGALRPEVGDGGLMLATFPPGSVTGAPKVRAMEVIAEVETTGREVYTGAIGVVSPVAGAEWSVAIRTFEHDGDAVWLGVGGGIVADSDPDAELAECLTKARPLVEALGGSLVPLD
jgi:para-aminobenzoate synthetase / 4-amino-4-deoxychorismate lyase